MLLDNFFFVSSYLNLGSFFLGLAVSAAVLLAGFLTVQQHSTRHKKIRAAAHASSLSLDAIAKLFDKESGGLPAWLRAPRDHLSSAGWLNQALAVLWPHVSTATTTWAFKERALEELLNSTEFWKPAWLAASGVVPESLDLGSAPPTVTGIRIRESSAAGAAAASSGRRGTTRDDSMVIDVDFNWVSKLRMQIAMKTLPTVANPSIVDRALAFVSRAVTVKAVIQNVVARGQMRIVASPLLEEIPVIGALRISFLEAPTISYAMKSFGANPLLIPGLEAYLNNFISSQVLQPFKFPEGFVLPVAQWFGVDVSVPRVRPEGVLNVTVRSAAKVPRTDLFGSSDPYVRLFVADRLKLHTSVKSNTLCPVWDEQFQFVVHDSRHQVLTLELWDSDAFRPDDLIGRTEVPLHCLNLAQGHTNDLTLTVPRVGKRAHRQSMEINVDATSGGAAAAKQSIAEQVASAGRAGAPPTRLDEASATGVCDAMAAQSGGGPVARTNHPAPPSSTPEHKRNWRHKAEPTLSVSLQFFKFSSSEVHAAEAAQRGAEWELSASSPQTRRLLRGGMLYVELMHAEGLDTARAGLTKTFKLKVKVGPRGEAPVYKKTAERTGAFKGMNARDPVFDQAVDFLVDGDTAHAPETVITVEIWVDHFIRKSTFKGGVMVPLPRVMAAGRLREMWPLQGGDGELEMALEWQGMMETALA